MRESRPMPSLGPASPRRVAKAVRALTAGGRRNWFLLGTGATILVVVIAALLAGLGSPGADEGPGLDAGALGQSTGADLPSGQAGVTGSTTAGQTSGAPQVGPSTDATSPTGGGGTSGGGSTGGGSSGGGSTGGGSTGGGSSGGGTVPTGCLAKPSQCGWPDATNTGVPAGKQLRTQQGDLTVTQAGAVIDGLDIRGCLIINANDVTVRNSRIGANGRCEDYVVRSFDRSGVVIEDTEIVLTGWETKGIAFDGYTARRVWFHGGSDCAHMGSNVTIVDSFCDIPSGGPNDGPHYDGFQSDGGSNLVMRHNTIRVPYGQTSAILMSTNTSPITNVTIVDNLVAGGGYTIYCGTDSGGNVRGTLTVSGNRVSRALFSKGGYWGPATHCPDDGWSWD